MEFLDNLALPQSGENLTLLHYLLMLAKSVFLVYAGALFGSSLFSVWFNFAARRNRNPVYLKFSKDLIDLITSSTLFAFGLGIIPFLGIMLVYAQLLHDTAAPIEPYLWVSFLLFLISLIFLYSYKHSLHLRELFMSIGQKYGPEKGDESLNDYFDYSRISKRLSARSAIWGVIFLFVSLRIFVGASFLAVDNPYWEEAGFWYDLFFYWPAHIKFLHFITAGLAMSGIAFVVKKYFWDIYDASADVEYNKFAKRFSLSVALIFTIVQPVFLALNLFITPDYAINYFMFGITFVVLFLVFIAAHLLYSMIRHGKLHYANASFILVLLFFSFIIIKEQAAFEVSNEKNVVVLAAAYDEYESELLAAAGREQEEINGKDIYEVKCTACHLFDKPKVGPPHKEVLPKYVNDIDALVKFLLNPVKIDPDYPQMPNQALKPREAEAVAEYMLEEYGPKL